MIVVKIEMWPGGLEIGKRDLGVIEIANTGGTTASGDYAVRLAKSAEYAGRRGTWRKGVVTAFPRRRLGPYDLLLRALAAVIADRNPEAARAAAVALETIERDPTC